MYRPLLRGVLCLALTAFTSAACEKSNESATPTTPGPVEVAEPDFTGTLTINGGVTQPFSVAAVGQVTVIVTSLTPNNDLTLSIGVALGTWNGTSCATVVHNDNVGVGGGIAASANAAGDLCVRVYDVGQLTEPVTFVLSITHAA